MMTTMPDTQSQTPGVHAPIGRGTWLDKLALDLVKREKRLGRSLDLLRVESGLGASGIPHIGSLGDAARAYGVKLALEDMGYKSELVAYSDDLDGLRKIPEGMPDSLSQHLGRPVSLIPDPYGCHDSYGMHMSSILLDGLDRVGIQYKFRRAADTYREGLLSDQIHTILQNSQRIGKKITELVGQEKYVDRLPYFPVCAECERLYTAIPTQYMADQRCIMYVCGDAVIGSQTIKGCGHKGEVDITKDLGKLAWKVEFAARWAAFDIRFEAYGKDIMDSVRVNDWVADNILDFAHPHHVKYEMFLDKGGKKISKSLGNVLTAQRWLEFGSPESILLLLYKRIAGARELGLEDIPSLMAEYDELEDIYFGKTKIDNVAKLAKSRGLYEYANLLDPPKQSTMHVNYRLLVELARIFRQDRTVHIVKKLQEYNILGSSSSNNNNPNQLMSVPPEVEKLITLAGNFADEFDTSRVPTGLDLDEPTRGALRELANTLFALDTNDNQSTMTTVQKLYAQDDDDLAAQKADLHTSPDNSSLPDIQNMIYQIARSHNILPKILFKALYQIILGTTRGPRIGPFILDVGPRRVAEMILVYV